MNIVPRWDIYISSRPSIFQLDISAINFKLLAIFYDCTGKFLLDLIGTQKCWFSRAAAHVKVVLLPMSPAVTRVKAICGKTATDPCSRQQVTNKELYLYLSRYRVMLNPN